MGGRGARGARGGGLGGGLGGGIGAGAMLGAGAQPPNVVPGQPVPAITIQQLQAMDDTQFVNYLNGLKSTPIDPNTYYNSNWDTQRLVANMPELNKAPQVVDAQTFDSLPGAAIYRTVNAEGSVSAVDICGRTMASDVTTIGGGAMGDGFYFATDLRHSQRVYGLTSGNINKTATMAAKLSSNAKIVSYENLLTMVGKESSAVRSALNNMSGGGFRNSFMTAYALRKGYNVVEYKGSGYFNIIDRSAATWSGQIIPKS